MRPESLWLCLLFCASPVAGQGADPLAAAQRALREGRPAAALALYEARLQKMPGDADARVGAGFAALRLDQPTVAQRHFESALASAPSYADAVFGLALCADRLGFRPEALTRIRQALALESNREEFKEFWARLDPPAPKPPPPVPPPPAFSRPLQLQVPFRVDPEGFLIPDGSGGWKRIYLNGINLGAALPGRFPSEFPDRATYAEWIAGMAELGVNVIRAYTVHPPAFYEALRAHNLSAKAPLYLIHGVWAEPPPEDDFGNPTWFQEWREEMLQVIDLLHGRADILLRPGHSGGSYRADVSPWWIGTILGREWEPFQVVTFNRRHPGISDWVGRFVRIRQGEAMERFLAQGLEAFLALEFERYHAQRPVAFTNWPTLDVMHHPSETPFMEEQRLRKDLGLPYVDQVKEVPFDDDAATVDMEKFEGTSMLQAGLFASYHIYPNYPEFINLDPAYGKARDEEGPNNYLGYLQDLIRQHPKHAVLVSEFGISTSQVSAHWQPQGFSHGGLSEADQARLLPRFIRNIFNTGFAGGILFAWIDEWFKKTWQFAPIELPADRKPLWFNAMDAEENYGLIAMRPGANGAAILIDGKGEDWARIPPYLQGGGLTLKLLADAGWLHLGLFWTGSLPDWTRERLLIGLDTLDPTLGNHQLPFGTPFRSQTGLEFMVVRQGESCEVWVDRPYEYSPHRRTRPVRTLAHEDGPWVQAETETNRERVGRDRAIYPARRYNLGTLRRGTQDPRNPAYDSRAQWQEGPGSLEIRIPWTLLNVTDPSSHRVLQDPPKVGEEYGFTRTDGIRALVVQSSIALTHPAPTRVLPLVHAGQIPIPPTFVWPGWQTPTWHSYRKKAFDTVRDALSKLPSIPKSRSAP